MNRHGERQNGVLIMCTCFCLSVDAGSWANQTAVSSSAVQARRAEKGEDGETGHWATYRAQCGEVQDSHAWKVGTDDLVQMHLYATIKQWKAKCVELSDI